MARNRKHGKINKKVVAIQIICAAALCFGLFAFALFAESNNMLDHVTGLTLKQEGSTIVCKWDSIKCKGYNVSVRIDGRRAGKAYAKSNSYVLRNIKYNHEYKICVAARMGQGTTSADAEETIYTLQPQTIKTSTDVGKGFAMERFSLKAKAKGELSYSSTNDEVASVDETGEVYLHRDGSAVIKVTAAETEDTAEAVKRIPVTVYPQQLSNIVIDKEYKSDTSVELSWSKVAFADEYILKKYSTHDDKYKKVGTYDPETTSVKLARENAKYKIEAKSDVHGTILETKSEEPVEVVTASVDARSYGDIKIIGTIGASDVDTVTTIRGIGSVNNPQSMCCTKDSYVVAFVTKSNSGGLLKSYSKDGELQASRTVGNMHHANGCTYNPYADRIYVCPTYAGHKERSLEAYDPKTLEHTGTIGLHNAPSGVAYDDTNNLYYMSASWRLYVTDSDFNVVKVIRRKRYHRSQDMGAFNGVGLSCIWTGGVHSYIDMYRASDSAYIGSYSVPLGEIESVCVDDGHLVILINKGTDVIYRTKDRVGI